MRIVELGLETKTKQMVMSLCCLVLVKSFHAVLDGGSFLVLYADVGFALLFYIIGFKDCISFLLRMLVCGTLNI